VDMKTASGILHSNYLMKWATSIGPDGGELLYSIPYTEDVEDEMPVILAKETEPEITNGMLEELSIFRDKLAGLSVIECPDATGKILQTIMGIAPEDLEQNSPSGGESLPGKVNTWVKAGKDTPEGGFMREHTLGGKNIVAWRNGYDTDVTVGDEVVFMSHGPSVIIYIPGDWESVLDE